MRKVKQKHKCRLKWMFYLETGQGFTLFQSFVSIKVSFSWFAPHTSPLQEAWMSEGNICTALDKRCMFRQVLSNLYPTCFKMTLQEDFQKPLKKVQGERKLSWVTNHGCSEDYSEGGKWIFVSGWRKMMQRQFMFLCYGGFKFSLSSPLCHFLRLSSWLHFEEV